MKNLKLENITDQQLARALTDPVIDIFGEDEELGPGRDLSTIDDNTLARALTNPVLVDL